MITVELNNRKMKSYAMLGVLGGVLFMIGDCQDGFVCLDI